MERRLDIKTAEIGAALLLTVGTIGFGYRQIEAESMKPTLLQKGENLELYGTCRTGDTSVLKTLIQPGERAAIAGYGEYLIMGKANIKNLDAAALEKGANTGSSISAGGLFSESPFPGVHTVEVATHAVISNDPGKRFQPYEIPPKSYIREDKPIEVLRGRLICPQGLLSNITSKLPWNS